MHHAVLVRSRFGDHKENGLYQVLQDYPRFAGTSTPSSAGKGQATATLLGRERNAEEPTRKMNDARLSRLLESNKANTVGGDIVSVTSAEESIGVRSDTPGAGNRRGFRGLLRSSSTRSLNGGSRMVRGGGSVDETSKPTLRSPSSRARSSRYNLQDIRQDKRHESRQCAFVRVANRLCCTSDAPFDDVDENRKDALGGTELDPLDMTETEHSMDSSFLDRSESEGGRSITADSIEGCSVRSFEKQEQPKKPSQPKAFSEPFAVPTRSDRRGSSMVSRDGSGNRPTLRRTMSTPSLHEAGIRSILKKGDALSSTQPRVKNEWSVRFDSVQMREFDLTLGDNPSVSRGVPIALDWNYNPKPIVQTLEEYELDRRPRRDKNDLALPPARRAHLLHQEWGVSIRDLRQTVAETDHIRNQRWQSATQKPIQYKRDEILETTKRRVGRAFTGGKRKELELLRELGVTDVAFLNASTTDSSGVCIADDI